MCSYCSEVPVQRLIELQQVGCREAGGSLAQQVAGSISGTAMNSIGEQALRLSLQCSTGMQSHEWLYVVYYLVYVWEEGLKGGMLAGPRCVSACIRTKHVPIPRYLTQLGAVLRLELRVVMRGLCYQGCVVLCCFRI